MSVEPPPLPPAPRFNGWHKTLIAIAPLLIAYIVMFFSLKSDMNNDAWLIPCLALLGIGGVLAGVFAVTGIRKANPGTHPVLSVILFLAVLIAYTSMGFFGTCLVGLAIST